MSGGLQSPARCPDCGAHLTLRMDCTRGETWPCTCRRGLFGTPPPESIAATVEALVDVACPARPFGCGREPGEPLPCTCDTDHRRAEEARYRADVARIAALDLAAPTDLDRANARRIIAEQRLETLRDALRETVATWREGIAAHTGDDAATRASAIRAGICADWVEALLAAQAGDESGEHS